MFSDFLWQLIPQLKCPLFWACFLSLNQPLLGQLTLHGSSWGTAFPVRPKGLAAPQTQPWHKWYWASSAAAQTLPSQHRQTEANLCCGQQKWLRSSFWCTWMERRTAGLPAQPLLSANPKTGTLATALELWQHRLSPEPLHGQQQDNSAWHWIPFQGMHNEFEAPRNHYYIYFEIIPSRRFWLWSQSAGGAQTVVLPHDQFCSQLSSDTCTTVVTSRGVCQGAEQKSWQCTALQYMAVILWGSKRLIWGFYEAFKL